MDETSGRDEESIIMINSTIENNCTIPKKKVEESNIQNVVFQLPELIKNFCGQQEELEKIEHWIFEDNKNIVVIYGLPGFGKTELVKKFVWKCKDDNKINNIFWIHADTKDNIEESFKNLSELLNFDIPDVHIPSFIKSVYERFDGGSSIFVFDNIAPGQSIQNILDFEPPTGCIILITTYIKNWTVDIPCIELSALDSCTSLLDAILEESNVHLSNGDDFLIPFLLFPSLQYMPLALQIEGPHLREQIIEFGAQFDCMEYLNHSDEKFIYKTIPETSGNPYNKSIYQGIEVMLQQLESINTPEINLVLNILHVSAYLGFYESPDFSDICNILHMGGWITTSSKRHEYDDNMIKAISILKNLSLLTLKDDDDVNENDYQFYMSTLLKESLLHYQYHHCIGNENEYYNACLEYILHNDTSDSCNILKYADRYISTFRKFYQKNKANEKFDKTVIKFLVGDTNIFLENLVQWNCVLSVTEILKDIGERAKDQINKFKLMHLATGCPEVLKALLEFGGDINMKDNCEKSVLHNHVFNLNFKCLQLLMDHGADVNAKDNEENSVLHCLLKGTYCHKENPNTKITDLHEALQLLIKCGAKTDVVDKEGNTLVHEAVISFETELVDIVVTELQLNVNAQNNNKMTPLHMIAYDRRKKEKTTKIIEILIKHGACLDIKNSKAQTPLEVAQECKNEYIVALLKKKIMKNAETNCPG